MLFATQTNFSVEKLGLMDGVKLLIDAGYPALDFSFFGEQDFVHCAEAKENAKRVRALAEDSGVIFHQAHAPYGGYLEAFLANHAHKFPKVFEFAGALGVDQIVVHPIRPTPRYLGSERAYFDANLEYYASLAPMARDCGVKIAIENMYGRNPVTNRIENAICGNAAELAALYDALGDDGTFTVCLDIGHAALCGFEPEDAIRTLGHDRLGALHVQDVDYKTDLHFLPGTANINWDRVCRALGEIDYKGVFNLETDKFLAEFDVDFYPTVTRFMAQTAKYYADKVDSYRIKR